MASLSFRDRFFSPPVGRALTSPSGILALGGGAALGVLATIATGGLAPLAAVVGGVIGGALGYGGRVALAIPRKGKGPIIDPFAIDEPWRYAVRDALQARNRFNEAMRGFKTGPLLDSIATLGSQLDDAVEECWNVAQGGQRLSEARKRINDREVQWELQQAASQIPRGGAASPLQAQTIEALNAQLATAARVDAQVQSTYDELKLLNARLDQAVTQAIELSVSNRPVSAGPVGADLTAIVDRLSAMGEAMDDVDDLSGDASDATAALPPPPAGYEGTTEPPQRPQTSPPS